MSDNNSNYLTVSEALEKHMVLSGNTSTSAKMQYMVRALEVWKDIRNNVLKTTSHKWVKVDKSVLPYRVEMPKCASMFLNVTIKNDCGEYVSLDRWSNMVSTPYVDVSESCSCDDQLKSCIESESVDVETNVTNTIIGEEIIIDHDPSTPLNKIQFNFTLNGNVVPILMSSLPSGWSYSNGVLTKPIDNYKIQSVNYLAVTINATTLNIPSGWSYAVTSPAPQVQLLAITKPCLDNFTFLGATLFVSSLTFQYNTTPSNCEYVIKKPGYVPMSNLTFTFVSPTLGTLICSLALGFPSSYSLTYGSAGTTTTDIIINKPCLDDYVLQNVTMNSPVTVPHTYSATPTCKYTVQKGAFVDESSYTFSFSRPQSEFPPKFVNDKYSSFQSTETKKTKVYTNGDVFIETITPYEKLNDSGNLIKIEMVSDKKFICKLKTKECGCIELSQENLQEIENCFCTEVSDRCKSICNAKFTQPNDELLGQNESGYFSYAEPDRNIYLYGAIPNQVMINFKTKGDSEEDELMPDYVFMTFSKGMDWINSRYSKLMNRLEKNDYERDYKSAKAELELSLPRSKFISSNFNNPLKDFFPKW